MKAHLSLSHYPKVVIWTVFLLGASAWYLPGTVAGGLAIICMLTALSLGVCKRPYRKLIWIYFGFILLWSAGRFGFALYNGQDIATGALLSLDLAIRFMILAGAGTSLLLILTPCGIAKEAGLSIKWLMPKSFWKLSLALLIMLSYFEVALTAWKGLSQTIALRTGSLPLHQKMRLVGIALLRILSQQTWDRTLAVASRKLDSPEAWIN